MAGGDCGAGDPAAFSAGATAECGNPAGANHAIPPHPDGLLVGPHGGSGEMADDGERGWRATGLCDQRTVLHRRPVRDAVFAFDYRWRRGAIGRGSAPESKSSGRAGRKRRGSFSGYERAGWAGVAGRFATAGCGPRGFAESGTACGVLVGGDRHSRDRPARTVVPAIAARKIGAIPAMAGAFAICIAKRFPTSRDFIDRMDSGNRDSDDVSGADSIGCELLWTVSISARLAICLAVGKTCGTVAADARWNWNQRSGVGGITVPFWCSTLSGSCFGACLGRSGDSWRADGGHCGVPARPEESSAADPLKFSKMLEKVLTHP